MGSDFINVSLSKIARLFIGGRYKQLEDCPYRLDAD